jgi:hypothetical protein
MERGNGEGTLTLAEGMPAGMFFTFPLKVVGVFCSGNLLLNLLLLLLLILIEHCSSLRGIKKALLSFH